MKRPRILDCTLRDGSYAIDFQFSADDTATIATALEGAGMDLIEVGHGVGLGASRKGLGVAAETDEAYMDAAASALKTAAWGMFCIPGIAELDDIDVAAGHGMNFIRIGTNITDYADSEPFIARAKKHDLFVCSNFMKSYVSEPEFFATCAEEVLRYGSDLVYLVDSAGGMFPADIERYARAVRDRHDSTRLGFHGHDNLRMGVANSLKAVELGFEIIDTSLQGFGRSAGNTATEQFLCALLRQGIDMDIDPIPLMDVGEQHIVPLMQGGGCSSIDTISGLAQFHSSYLAKIKAAATKYRVDPRRLIVSVCEKDRLDAPDDLIEAEARRLLELGVKGNWKPLYKHYYGGEQDR